MKPTSVYDDPDLVIFESDRGHREREDAAVSNRSGSPARPIAVVSDGLVYDAPPALQQASYANWLKASPHYIGCHCVAYFRRSEPAPQAWDATITRTERQVLALIAQSLTTPQIADQLVKSPKTIEKHRYNICRKLGLRGTNSLSRFALMHRRQLCQKSTTRARS